MFLLKKTILDKRLANIKTWLSHDLGLDLLSIAPASADASFRRYFRATISEKSAQSAQLPTIFIVMDSPPEHEDNELFIRCAKLLHKCQLNVPIIFQTHLQKGMLILSDLGTQLYQGALNKGSVDSLYHEAFTALLKMQALTLNNDLTSSLESYDALKLADEMTLFEQWYIQHYQQTNLSDHDSKILTNSMECLIESALQQPQVLVHRDFHCRNLLITADNSPGVIDFQDMVIGPICYDIVSLLKDCYIKWPAQDVKRWAIEFHQLSLKQGLHSQHDEQQWLKWFDWMGVQRHLKVLGIFSRLYFRDGKDQYMGDIPLVHKYLIDTCEHYPELSGLAKLLRKYSPKKDLSNHA